MRCVPSKSCFVLLFICSSMTYGGNDDSSSRVAMRHIFKNALHADDFSDPVMMQEIGKLEQLLDSTSNHKMIAEEIIAMISETAQGTDEWWVLSHLIQNSKDILHPSDVGEVVFTTMESEDEDLRDAAAILLGTFESSCVDAEHPTNLVLSKAVIRVRLHFDKELLPTAVRRMYEVSPDRGLMFMLQAHNDERDAVMARETEWAVHIISTARWRIENEWSTEYVQKNDEIMSTARSQMLKLARSEVWWVKYYAANVMHRYPELGTPEVVAALATSTHGLLKDIVSQIDQ